METKTLRVFLYVLLIFYFSLFFAQKINLTTADLGRHITNGKIFIEQKKIVSTNYYSYTQPDFSVVNHHWLSGVVFYLVQNSLGFTGLSFFYTLLSGLTIFIFFYIAKSKSNFAIALLSTFLLIPLMVTRKEIRPEVFSYLFLGVYYLSLSLLIQGKTRIILVYPLLFLLQVFWVNAHLFFIMGILLIGVFTFEQFILLINKRENLFKRFIYLLIISVFASLINPFGVQGLVEPLNILKEYGYMIIENQTVFFMLERAPQFAYKYFIFSSITFLLFSFYLISQKKLIDNLAIVLLALVFLVLGFRAIRGIPIAGMFFVPFFAVTFYQFKDYFNKKVLYIFSLVLFLYSLVPNSFLSVSFNRNGYGLMPGVNNSAEFFKQNNLTGHIFNNYDIGGYLIYHLYDRERVFVDNRPEAYSVEFFERIYIPMQEHEEIWNKVSDQYNINSIFFYRHDATPWAQPFLITRIKDPNWIPVFVDDFTLILVKNNEVNRQVIEKHKLPESIFAFTNT